MSSQQKEDKINQKVWILHNQQYLKSTIISQTESHYIVNNTKGEYKISKSETYPVNSEDFDLSPNLSQLSYLNEPSVLNILTSRFFKQKIYTNSGIFLVALNPYRNLDIYNKDIMKYYSRLTDTSDNTGFDEEIPPHIFRITSSAYSQLLNNREDHSILITGESGAGKTENTKKVIQYISYLDSITNNKIKKDEIQISDLIMETTELLEFFGNAKTTRNDNSSRFGKFIKLIFNGGKLVGAKVDKYLLEKGRVTDQNIGERNYHIFHALVSSSIADKFYVKNVKSSVFRNKELIIINEEKANEQLAYVSNALKKISINVETVLKIISSIILLNSLEFKEQNEQASLDSENQEIMKKISELLEIDANAFTAAIIYPKKKVGNEEITYNISVNKAKSIITGFSRYIYEKLFDHLIERINANLYISDTENNNNFISILDIAGFEIFKKNSFEQLCINYTNEKLQQYFNHTMFISEQKLYENEGIKWNYIDFGLDLQPTIDFLESNNPIGVFSMLDEESIMPKGNETNFINKLSESDSTKFKKEEYNKSVFELDELNKNIFRVHHYAGTVNYNIYNWVMKNKDTTFDFFNNIFMNCNDSLIKNIILNNQLNLKGIGKGFFKTVAQTHKAQLNLLMDTLTKTIPHFVRCIIPNETKRFDEINTDLMLKQLRCNGVLEGIRISRKGYPNRLLYNDFRKRYTLLLNKPNIIASEPTTEEIARNITNEIIKEINLEEFNKIIAYGRNKIFLKSGALAILENLREEKIKQFCIKIKPLIKSRLFIMKYLRSEIQMKSIERLKKNINKFLNLRKDSWWRLFLTVKPLLDVSRNENKMKEKEDEINKLKKELNLKEEEINIMKLEIKELGFKYETLNSNFKEETEKNLLNDEKIMNLAELNLEKTKETQNLNKELNLIKEELIKKEKEIQNLNKELEIKKEESIKKEKELNEIKNNYEKQTIEFKKQKVVNEKLNQEIEIANLKLKAIKVESESELQNMLLIKQTELSNKQIDIDNYLIENKENKRELNELKDELNELKMNYKIKEEENNKKEILLNQLNKEKIEKEELINKTNKTTLLLNNKINELEKENKSMESQNEDISYNLLTTEKKYTSLRNEINSKTLEISSLKTDLENEKSNNQILNQKIKEEVEIKNRELELQKQEYEKSSDVAKKLMKSEKKLIQLQNSMENLQTDYDNIINEQTINDEKWLNKLKQFNEEKQIEIKKLKNLITDQTFEIKKLEREINELKNNSNMETDTSIIEEYNNIILKEKSLSKELRNKLSESEQKLILLEGMKSNVDESHINNLLKTVNQLDSDLNIFYNSTIKNIFNEFSIIKSQNDELLNEVTNKLKKIHELDKLVQNKEIQLAMEKTKMESLLNENESRESFKSELKKLKSSLLKYKMFDKQTLLEKQALLLEIESLKNLIDNDKKQLNVLNNQIAELILENENIRRQNSIESQLNIIDNFNGISSEGDSLIIDKLENKIKSLETNLNEKLNEIEVYELREKSRIKMDSKGFRQFFNKVGNINLLEEKDNNNKLEKVESENVDNRDGETGGVELFE